MFEKIKAYSWAIVGHLFYDVGQGTWDDAYLKEVAANENWLQQPKEVEEEK